MVIGVEPTAPKPIQIYTGRILHRSEKVSWRGVLKSPPSCVLFKSIIKQISAHYGFTQNVQCRGGLAVRIVAELIDWLRIRHNRANPWLIPTHVASNVASTSASCWIIAIKFLFREVLNKCIQSFVHPSPLPFIWIDAHGKEVVSHLMNDNTDHSNLRAFCVGSIRLRTTAVETNHRILHTNPLGVNTDSDGIGICYSKLWVCFQGLSNCLGGILLPQWIPFFGVKAHRQRRSLTYPHCHSIPNKLPARSPREVTNILCIKYPCLHSLLFGQFSLTGLLFRNDHNRLIIGYTCGLKPLSLLRCKHLFFIFQHTCWRHNMVRRNIKFNVVITKIHSKLPIAQKLLVLPPLIIGIHHHPRIKLSNGINVIVLFLKIFVAASSSNRHAIIDVIAPCNIKHKRSSRLDRTLQINTHHRIVNGMAQGPSWLISYIFNLKSTVERWL